MDTMTPNQAIAWLMSNDNSLGGTAFDMQTSLRAMGELPPGSQAYQAHQSMLDANVARVEQAKREQEFEQAGVDPAFASVACDCAPGEPCCLRAFEVVDEKKASRKVTWPVPEGKPRTLFVIAKDPHNGSPAGKVKVSLTDYDPCKNGTADRPGMNAAGFANDPKRFSGDLTQTMVATVPFHLPNALSAFLPRELLIAIYVIGYYTLATAYDDDDQCNLTPYMCMTSEGSSGLRVQAMPHLKLTADVQGSIAVGFEIGGLPTLKNSLAGKITGEFGNQTLDYKKEAVQQIAPTRPRAQGPVRNPVLGVMGKIFEKAKWMSESNAPGYAPPGGIPRRRGTTITVTKTLSLAFEELKLEGKEGSPDLRLAINPIALRFTLGVSGTLDLIELLLNRVPGIADAVRDTRDVMADKSNPASAELICDLTLGAEGGLEFGVENALSVTIGSAQGWEAEFDKIATRFQADAKISGELRISARVGVNTWFFDGAAGAEGSVSTAWHFGGRQMQTSGKKTNETLYFFEGLVVKGRYYVEFGRQDDEKDSVDFSTGSSQTEGKTEITRSATNISRLVDREFTASFFATEGNKDDWKPAA